MAGLGPSTYLGQGPRIIYSSTAMKSAGSHRYRTRQKKRSQKLIPVCDLMTGGQALNGFY